MQELLEVQWGGDFVGLGLDEEVPKFLRTNAKVKNRHMSKVSFLMGSARKLLQPADSMPVMMRCLAAAISMYQLCHTSPHMFASSKLASRPCSGLGHGSCMLRSWVQALSKEQSLCVWLHLAGSRLCLAGHLPRRLGLGENFNCKVEVNFN